MIKITNKFKNSKKEILKIKKNILLAAFKAKEGHIPSALSVLDIIYVLYNFKILNKCHDLNYKKRDRFLLSKGHGSLALYGVLNNKKFISDTDFFSYCNFKSKFGGHPDRTKSNLIEVSTGSLGHGLPMATGLAMSLKRQFKINTPKVFCVIGDGEANEGTLWETLLFISSRKINNLKIIVDFNMSGERALPIKNLISLLKGFKLHLEVIDGHNLQSIYNALIKKNFELPSVIIAHTIKGHGIKEMENNPEWHHKIPNDEELKIFLSKAK